MHDLLSVYRYALTGTCMHGTGTHAWIIRWGVGDVLHPCILLADSRSEMFLRCVMVMVRAFL